MVVRPSTRANTEPAAVKEIYYGQFCGCVYRLIEAEIEVVLVVKLAISPDNRTVVVNWDIEVYVISPENGTVTVELYNAFKVFHDVRKRTHFRLRMCARVLMVLLDPERFIVKMERNEAKQERSP